MLLNKAKGTNMISKIKYYISDSLDPYKNLATEKYLLENTSCDELTLYLWQNQNTVVIGRNQNPWAECNVSLLNEDGGHLARRLSGGGAVFHDLGNLNFTFLCSAENYDLKKNLEVIKTACSLSGIDAEISGRNDILADGRKFSGNAFYNSKGKSYHHGTILISADKKKIAKYLTPTKAKLDAKGVKSVKSRVINLSELNHKLTIPDMRENMLSALQKIYSLEVEPFKISDTKKISDLEEKYKSWDYLFGNTFPFTLSLEEHFSWGHIEILLQIEKGIIKDTKVYTDSMDWTISEKLNTALKDCRFEHGNIKDALSNELPESVADDIIELVKTSL